MAVPISAITDISAVNPPTTATFRSSIVEKLHQATAECEAAHWEKVISLCESAMAEARQCQRQCQQVEMAAAAAEEPPSPTIPSAESRQHLKTAEECKQEGNIDGAVRAYLQALQQQPRLYPAYNRLRYNLMRYDIAEGDPILEEIVAVCQQIIERFPQLHAARVTLAYGLTKLDKIVPAVECYQQTSNLMTLRQLTGDRTVAYPNVPASVVESTVWGPRQSPSFMVIGAEKCGTTSLFQYLAKHPDILSTVEKEIDFFDMEYKRGLDWYLAHFPALPATISTADKFAVGETSANYLYDASAPERMFKHFPNIQLVVLLRHPVDRTISRYNMMVRNGSEKRSLEVAIAEEIQQIQQAVTPAGIAWPVLNRCRHIGNSLYALHLQRWLAKFSREQLLVLRSETLFAQPERTLSGLCRQLGIGAPPAQRYEKHNAGTYSTVPLALRQQLHTFYQPYISQLEDLLSQSFDWGVPS